MQNVNAYVNMFISREAFADAVVNEVIEKRDDYGRSDMGQGKKVIVEYSSPEHRKTFSHRSYQKYSYRKLNIQDIRFPGI